MCFRNTGWLKFKFSLPAPVTKDLPTSLIWPHYSSAEQDSSPFMARKEKTPVTVGALPLLPCKHTLRFCRGTYTPHIFTMSDDMDKLPLGVNYHCYKGDSAFQKEEKNAFWKSNYQQPLEMYVLKTEDSLLREWLLITALKLLTIWFNNQKLEAVLCFGHNCRFLLFAYLYLAQEGKNPQVTTQLITCHTHKALHWAKGQIHTSAQGITLREGADSHLSSIAAVLSKTPQACRNTAATIKPLTCSQHCRKSTSACAWEFSFQPLFTPALTLHTKI